MAMEWNDPDLPWQNSALPWKSTSLSWNNVSLPWKAGSELPVGHPYNDTPPTISGTPTQGQTLSVTAGGIWGGDPALTFTYQWYRTD